LIENGFGFKEAKGSHQLNFNAKINKTAIVLVQGEKVLKKDNF
jgi:predicted RNA binding protein YcfA (HicA-like mRNA interferase family)